MATNPFGPWAVEAASAAHFCMLFVRTVGQVEAHGDSSKGGASVLGTTLFGADAAVETATAVKTEKQ